jgi:hypothetical protein
MKIFLSSLLVVVALQAGDVLAEGKWQGTGFSADFSQTFEGSGQQDQNGRLFLDSEGMRMEMTEEGQAVVTIMRFSENDMLMLMPDAKMYMQMPFSAMGQQGAGTLEGKFASACAEYREGEKLGSETVNGRATEKWRCVGSTNDEPDADIWFDQDLGAPIRVVDDAGSRFELSNIKEGDQAAGLFQPPADYQRMSMQDMMQMDQ